MQVHNLYAHETNLHNMHYKGNNLKIEHELIRSASRVHIMPKQTAKYLPKYQQTGLFPARLFRQMYQTDKVQQFHDRTVIMQIRKMAHPNNGNAVDSTT